MLLAHISDIIIDDFQISVSLPHRRDLHLMDRPEVLATLHEYLTSQKYLCDDHSHPKVVLYEPAPVGKTQLALLYANTHQYDFSSIFWIEAESARSIEWSFFDIAHQLLRHYESSPGGTPSLAASALGLQGILGADPDQIDLSRIVSAVMEWFTRKENTRWLLIYDNANGQGYSDIKDFIPPTSSGRGHVIVTTRLERRFHCEPVGHLIRSLHVPSIPHEDVLKFLLNLAHQKPKSLAPEGISINRHYLS